MKQIYLSIIFLFSLNVDAQKEINTEWKTKINQTFQGLDKTKIPNEILLDYAMEFVDVPSYNGILTDSTYIDMDVFSNIYKTLFMGKVTNDTIHFPSLHHIAYNWTNERINRNIQDKETLVLAGLYYNYSKIRTNALSQNKIRVFKNRYFDKYINGIWQNPYETRTAMAFSPPINHYNKRNIKIVLPTQMMLGNVNNQIQKIEINVNDGLGYRQLNYNQELAVNYSANGIYDWVFKLTLNNNQIYYSRTKMEIEQKFISKKWKNRNN